MGEPVTVYRLLVTGSRDYGRPDIIRGALMEAQAAHPGCRLVLVHGMCNPRHPDTGQAIVWHVARLIPAERMEDLLGADWLADVIATRLGWETEPHPADWHRGKSAGYRRNGDMVKLGADDCYGFISPCAKPGCRDPQPHGSHGASHCADLAAKAGIDVRRFTPDGT
jgi:hypothetical protein